MKKNQGKIFLFYYSLDLQESLTAIIVVKKVTSKRIVHNHLDQILMIEEEVDFVVEEEALEMMA